MSIEDARKHAMLAAIAAMGIGVLVIIAMMTVYWLYGSRLDSLPEQQGSAAANVFLVKAVKVAGFRLVPLLSFVLIVLGGCMLSYLRKESKTAFGLTQGRPSQ